MLLRHLRLRYKLLISFLSLNLVCTGLAGLLIYLEMRPHFLEAVEYTLIDMSRFLAAELSAEAEKSPDLAIRTEGLKGATEKLRELRFPERNFFDRINRSRLQVYVTDATGRVIFDSETPSRVGQDFSGWRDVALSLKREYGARATRTNPVDPATSTHFVAAPILARDRVIGVIAIGKPVESVAGFLQSSKLKILLVIGMSLTLALAASAFAAYWIARPVLRLAGYVNDLRGGKSRAYPPLPEDEIGALGRAFENLRTELEGKKYVENYVHHLTHEIKSPLTGIIGAAELLGGPELAASDRARLLDNVRSEARRLQDIAEKLLELASLETGDRVVQDEDFDLALLVDEVADAFTTQARTLGVTIVVESPESLPRRGERFLIWRALANLVQNALDFSPAGGRVTLRVTERGVEVTDEGPGIPEFAQMRVTERFFSMERPRTGRKSSGLGLSFVQEVMRIHRGELRIESGGKEPPSGTKSALNW